MISLHKKCLKKAVSIYCSLPDNYFYNEPLIEQISFTEKGCFIYLDQKNIKIYVYSDQIIDKKYVLKISFIRKVNGKNKVFDSYETAYNFSPEN